MPKKLDAVEPERRLRAAGYAPLVAYPGSITAWWLSECTGCGCRKERQLRKVSQARCQMCLGYSRRVSGEEAVAVMRSAGFEPLEPYAGADARWRCVCLTCGTESQPRLATAREGHACGECYRRRQIRDAAEMAAEALTYGYVPAETWPGWKHTWRLTCLSCRSTRPRWLTNIQDGHRCGDCSGFYVDPGAAAAVMRERGLAPQVPYPGAATPWRCRCTTCGRDSYPVYGYVRNRNGKVCFWCDPSAPLDPVEATAVMVAAGLTPQVPYPGSRHPWPSVCDEGHHVSPTLYTVKAGSACRDCASYGFNLTKPALVYVLTHPLAGAHKVGGTAEGSTRLAMWRRRGWQIAGTESFATGAQAWVVEREVLHWLRQDLGLPEALSDGQGHTETVDAVALPAARLLAAVTQAAARVRADGSAATIE